MEKEVDEVNQYAAPIYNPTAGATISVFCLPTNKIVINKPKVAMISDIKIPLVNLLLSDMDIMSNSNIIFAKITPTTPPIN